MNTLAALLLCLIAAVHYGPELAAQAYTEPEATRRAIYYVARSFEGATQYALIALLALAVLDRRRKQEALSLWWGRAEEPGCSKGSASAYVSATLVSLVCIWGIVEHLQAGACRLAIGIENRLPAVPPMAGLCDVLTRWPLYALGLGVVAFIAAVIAAYSWESRDA